MNKDSILDQYFNQTAYADDAAARSHCHAFYRSLAEQTGLTFDSWQHVEQCFPIWQTDWNIHTAIRDGRRYEDDGKGHYFDGERQGRYHDDESPDPTDQTR